MVSGQLPMDHLQRGSTSIPDGMAIPVHQGGRPTVYWSQLDKLSNLGMNIATVPSVGFVRYSSIDRLRGGCSPHIRRCSITSPWST